MKEFLGRIHWILIFSTLSLVIALFNTVSTQAKVTDTSPITDQRWIISEIYLGENGYKGAYLEIYNNDNHSSLGWKDFVINLPINIDLPPLFGLQTYKPHTYKVIRLTDQKWVAWLAKHYVEVVYGDEVFHEIQDALDEVDGYSYQRCQSTQPDGTRVLSNKFYYGKKTPGKPILCSDKTINENDSQNITETSICSNLKLNEIAANWSNEKQFVEIENNGKEAIDLSECYITNDKSKPDNYLVIGDKILQPGQLFSIDLNGTAIGPIDRTSGIIYLIDKDEQAVVDYKKYRTPYPSTSLNINDKGKWQDSYQPTPNEDNVIKDTPDCPTNYIFNKSSHKCQWHQNLEIKKPLRTNSSTDIKKVKSCRSGFYRDIIDGYCYQNQAPPKRKPCREGYERNYQTNRCRKIAKQDIDQKEVLLKLLKRLDKKDYPPLRSSTTAPCRSGYIRNTRTNRCIKITAQKVPQQHIASCRSGYKRNTKTNRCIKELTKAATAKKSCREGYARNPETGRCKKIEELHNDQPADYPVDFDKDDTEQPNNSMVLGIIAILAVLLTGIILIWQYRLEIKKSLKNKTCK